jgi:hypothetical protein
MLYQLSIANDIFQIAYQTQFKENDGVDAFLSTFSEIKLGY